MVVRVSTLWLLLSFLVGSAPTRVWATENKPIHAMIVFDVSGSMRQSDPERSSVAAARLFSDLARAEDVVGLASFSGAAQTLVPLSAPMDARAKAHMQARLESLQFTGATTNLVAALEVGLAAFPRAEDGAHRNMVLLLTDGQLDLGKNRGAEEAAALEQIVHSLIPEYRRRGIALYTMAFTAAADHALLREMADASDGEFRFIANAATLHRAFGQMFIGSHQAESFPLEQNRMLIDDSIQELALVFEKSMPGERIALLTPGKEMLRGSDARAGAVWRSTPTYDLVNLRRPQAGEWLIERSGNTQQGVGIIASSTLSLQVEIGSTFIEAGASIPLRAFLFDKAAKGGKIRSEAGQTMTAELRTPAGESSSLTLMPQKDGSFAASIAPLQTAGKHSVTVTATTPTLKRQRAVTFAVRPECLQANVASTIPVTARASLSEACPAFKALAIEAEYTVADRSQRVALRAVRDRVYEASIPPSTGSEAGRVSLHFRGEIAGEKPFSLTKGPWPLPATASPSSTEPTQPSPVATSVVKKLLLVNGFLVLLGVIGYVAYRIGLRKGKAVHGRNTGMDSDSARRAAASR